MIAFGGREEEFFLHFLLQVLWADFQQSMDLGQIDKIPDYLLMQLLKFGKNETMTHTLP